MSYTKLQICNKALGLLSAESIPSNCSDPIHLNQTDCENAGKTWTDPFLVNPTNEAILCHNQYDILYDALLIEHMWTFATTSVEQTPIASTTPFEGYTFNTPKPATSIRIISVTDINKVSVPWALSGGYIYTNSADKIIITYISKSEAVDVDSALFADVLSLRIAAELCYTLTSSSKLYDFLTKQYESKLYNATNIDSMQGTNVNITYRGFAR